MKFKLKPGTFFIFFFIFIFSTTTSFAEKYKLECKIGAFNLEGTSFGDKTRLYNKIMNFDVDTDVGIYSPDLREDTDEVIIHGLWPDAKFSGALGNQELAWNNEIKIDDTTIYKYSSFLKKKTSRDKKNERILNITIRDYKISTIENIPNKLENTFKFKFKCTKIPLE